MSRQAFRFSLRHFVTINSFVLVSWEFSLACMLQSYCGLPRSLLCDSSFPFFPPQEDV
jgi:hypothetical protein